MAVHLDVYADLNDRSVRQASGKLESGMRQSARRAGDAWGREFGPEVEKAMGRAEKATDKVADATGRVRTEQKRLEALNSRGSTTDAQRVAQAERLAKAKRDEAAAVREAVRATNALSSAQDDTTKGFRGSLRNAVAGAGQSGQDAAHEFVGGFAGASALTRLGAAGGPIGLALAGVATLGVIAGKQLADGIAEGLEQLHMQDVFRTRMGLDPNTMNRFGSAAGAAWTNGFGESRESNLSTIDLGFQAHLLDRNASEQQVKKFVERMDTVAQITGESQQSLALGARGLVSGEMVKNYTDAFDLIIAAQQKGLNLTGDMMDTLNEYAINFKNLGLSGADALGLIDQMYQSNIRNSDLAADSLREFAISANDQSTTTKAAFRALGFSADDMGKQFAAGGDQAKDAFGAIMVALAGIEDPQERTNIGLALFKTRWEEANDAIMAMDLNSASTDFDNIDGKVDEATATLKEHENGWTNLGKTISNEVDKIQRSIADSGFGKWFMQDLPDEFGKFFSGHLFDDPPQTGVLPDITFEPGLSARQRSDLTDRPHSWGTTNRPVAGPPMSFNDAKKQMEDATKGAAGPRLPDVPVIPYDATVPGGSSPATFAAESSFLDARQKLAEKRARLDQLEGSNVASADDVQKARNDVIEAERDLQGAEIRLSEARSSAFDKQNKQLNRQATQLGEIGAQLDQDFGISKGLSGIAENITKFVANLAAAPLLGQLSAVSQANPTQGGHGLMGYLGATGALGPQYQNNQYADQRNGYAAAAMGPASLHPTFGGRQPYGLPAGTDTGGYGSSGAVFPPWVHALEQAFGVKASTYSGHQESDRHEAGYAPNPSGQNRGIDWTGLTENLQKFADYLATIPGDLEQVIWQNPVTGAKTGIGGGKINPGYYPQSTYDVHGGNDPSNIHVHTRQSQAIPLPGMAPSFPPAYAPAAIPSVSSPLPTSFGGGGAMAGGPPTAAPFNSPTPLGGITPTSGTGKGGLAMTQGGLLDTAIGVGASGLDMLAPGAGQLAQTGTKLLNRGIEYGGQVAGIGAQGLMETFLPFGASEVASNNWITRIVGGLAGAAPALPNMAGKSTQAPTKDQVAAVNPNNPQQGQGQGQGSGQTNHITVKEDPNRGAQGTGRDILEQLRYAGPGM
ncbi:phage tail tape measure protein [Mycobacterium syngnathidarum]